MAGASKGGDSLRTGGPPAGRWLMANRRSSGRRGEGAVCRRAGADKGGDLVGMAIDLVERPAGKDPTARAAVKASPAPTVSHNTSTGNPGWSDRWPPASNRLPAAPRMRATSASRSGGPVPPVSPPRTAWQAEHLRKHGQLQVVQFQDVCQHQ